MERLLSPNEATFWLMDRTAPMNGVAAVRTAERLDTAALARPSAFTLPVAALGPGGRPRWEETSRQGVVDEVESDDDQAWLRVAERLNRERVGTEGHPPWSAVVIQHRHGSTLLIAMLHALVDVRSGLAVTARFIAREHPGPVAPACEDMLPPSAYGRSDAHELLDAWWRPRAGTRWEAIGVERLAGYLASPAASVLGRTELDATETAALRARCHDEKVSIHGAVALALRDGIGARAVRYAVDMRRFIVPAPGEGPGVMLSHVDVELPAGDFWAAAREARERLRDRLATGTAGDALLRLPGLLLARTDEGAAALRAEMVPGVTISDLTHARIRGVEHRGCAMASATSSARGGGDVVSLSIEEGRLQLVSSGPSDRPVLPLETIAARLRRAILGP